tara:strand:- start:707 stop:1021 length:315 start_codon:yes stop_codon:yes gene_type:complete
VEKEEKKELEKVIANHFLNTLHFSEIFNLISKETKRRAKDVVQTSSDEQLLKMKNEIDEWQSRVRGYVETRAHGEEFQREGWGKSGSRPRNWTPAEGKSGTAAN